MNSDIATASAWTQADRTTQQTNIALNEYDAATERARTEMRLSPENFEPTAQLVRLRIRQRQRALHIALARVGAQLARIEGQQ